MTGFEFLAGTVTDLRLRQGDDQCGVEQRFLWQPSNRLASDLHPEFSLGFAVVRGADQLRRLISAEGQEGFLTKAGLLGRALLERSGEYDCDAIFTSRFHSFLFQQRRWIREALGRSFNNRLTLIVADSGRTAGNGPDVLPDDIGSAAAGASSDSQWTIGRLLEAGLSQCHKWHIACPNFAERLCGGLFSAAALAPLDLSGMPQEEQDGLLRLILFNFNTDEKLESGDDGEPVGRNFSMVQERVARALWDHLEDSTEDFARYFIEQTDGLIHRVAKQVRRGGTVSRAAVREIRVRMLVHSYRWMAQTLHAAMHEIRHSVATSFSDAELELYDLQYRSQSSLGGLTLLLLRDQLRQLGIDPLIVSGPQLAPSVLIRVLYYYAEMVGKRRAADRRLRNASETSLDSLAEGSALVGRDLAADAGMQLEDAKMVLGRLIAEFTKFTCSCPSNNSMRVVELEQTQDPLAELTIECAECHRRQVVSNSVELQGFLRPRYDD